MGILSNQYLDAIYSFCGEEVKTCFTYTVEVSYRNLSGSFCSWTVDDCLPGNLTATWSALTRLNMSWIAQDESLITAAVSQAKEVLLPSPASLVEKLENLVEPAMHATQDVLESAGSVLSPNTALIFSAAAAVTLGAAWFMNRNSDKQQSCHQRPTL